MSHDYNFIYALGLIAGSATFLRASLQSNGTVFDRVCDGAALLCLALLVREIGRWSGSIAQAPNADFGVRVISRRRFER